MALSSSGYAEVGEKGKVWKGTATNEDLVVVVNFLINNKGKNIELAGKKHRITGKEKLDVVINILDCCDEREFLNYISGFGKVKDVQFPAFYLSVEADKVPEIDKKGDVVGIKLEPKAHDFWMKVIKQ
jgi:hypothetical protein